MDVFTSAPWFDGFRETIRFRALEVVVRPVTDSRTWMLSKGWRRHVLLSVHEVPEGSSCTSSSWRGASPR